MERSAKDLALLRLAALRTDHSMCDAVLYVEGQPFPVHKLIVAQVSPFFKTALYGSFKEDLHKEIVLEQSKEVVSIVLDFSSSFSTTTSCVLMC